MSTKINTVIVGGGQGGLATSYWLTQQNREHIILEKAAQPANVWRNQRWDSFTLVTPNWQLRMPGAEYQGDDPDGFLHRDEVVTYLEEYIERFNLPIRYGIMVTSVEPTSDNTGYWVKTDETDFLATNVVIATGGFQKPKIPTFNANLPSNIQQLHSSQYRNPEMLPEGPVLVVGSGQSGCQIAEELYQSGRKVYLCVSRTTRAPRRYRGKDILVWADKIGLYDRTVDMLPSPAARFAPNPQASGKDGGHTINLHQFSRDGVTLLGHLQDIQDNRLILAPDLHENLAEADKFETELLEGIDKYISQAGLEAPPSDYSPISHGYEQEIITELALDAAGIQSVIWGTGYSFDYSLVRLSIVDEYGYPIQERGVTEYPGLYFVGLHWLHTLKSGLLFGVGDDAAHVAAHIADRD